MTAYEKGVYQLIVICILLLGVFCVTLIFTVETKTFEDAYNKAYEQCLTQQQNNTKISNKEYYCINYANAKVK